jgi:hypothetical protein
VRRTPSAVEPVSPHDQRPQEEMILHLERDQLVSETARPVPRATLARHTILMLWGLRFFVIVVGAMVLYTFVDQLH